MLLIFYAYQTRQETIEIKLMGLLEIIHFLISIHIEVIL